MNIINCIQCNKEHKACRKTQKFCSAKCDMVYRYAHGFKANTLKANETLRTKGQYTRDNSYLIERNKKPEIRAKISKSKTGKQVLSLQGKKHWNWQGGKSKEVWKTPKYQQWRKAVYRRDNYTCVECGDNSGGNLEADHIKPRYLYPELTYDINNGRTLCKDCHKATPTWGAKVKSLVRI